MTDCPNAEIRDRLPDFVHGQLAAEALAEVSRHVAACTACAAEVTLLRELRASLRATPSVDVARIVAALPRARGPAQATGVIAHRRWERFDWRVAAAVVALAIGGGSVAVWNNGGGGGSRQDVPSTGRIVQRGQPPVEVQRVAAADLSLDADLADASTGELESLLQELESFDGLPAGEPEPLLPNPGEGAER